MAFDIKYEQSEIRIMFMGWSGECLVQESFDLRAAEMIAIQKNKG